MREQVTEFASGNEMAAIAAKQIGYDLMGYYPITPSTQIAENLDRMKAEGETDLELIAAEGEHSAAGICYGASVGGGRVFNATSANGLLYALEQFPVQSGTRYPMVMNVVCRTVSGPLSIKCDHSDLMYLLNAGWPILFAHSVQEVYDLNLIALRLAEQVQLPVAVAYDGFFTSHQKRRCFRFASDLDVREWIGEKQERVPFFDFNNPVTVGSYMNEPDLINNRYQLHLAMEQVRDVLPALFSEFEVLSGRSYSVLESCHSEDAEELLILLGSSYDTAIEAVERLRREGRKAGVATLHVLRPFPADEIAALCEKAKRVMAADRQDSYGAGGGNLSLEIRAALQRRGSSVIVKNVVYGLGGADFDATDAIRLFDRLNGDGNLPEYDGVVPGEVETSAHGPLLAPLTSQRTRLGAVHVKEKDGMVIPEGITLNGTTAMPKRLAPGHGACPGCGIPVNLNLLLRAIEDPVVLLFQTGCAMIVSTAYPRTSFRVPYLHNLFQNGAATLSGLAEICRRKQRNGEIPPGDIVFLMVSGDGGMDIGMGSALGTALRGHRLLIFEYDNGGYMNTGYQLSYSTPKGARSATSHVGREQYGKQFFHKDTPQIMAAAGIPYVATAAESNPVDFMKKAVKAAEYAKHSGTAYLKALSACPLNWNDRPDQERNVIQAAVDCCYFPLYEVEQGKTRLSYDPQKNGKKIDVSQWFSMMGRTKHLCGEDFREVTEEIQQEIDRRYARLKEKSEHPFL
ncbi:MAG: pyruvate synthase [Lachnospiraceae bacterium]|nr:pyruvate synthase [Lachnospiraceae bacterium]